MYLFIDSFHYTKDTPFIFRLYFIGIALSGAFAVTFSIVFAYVADCTTEHERSHSYGLVMDIVINNSYEY